MEPMYDICIIGAGMVGSAAARHVTDISPQSKVCVIGPEELKGRSLENRRFIFGAYYDAGRIARQCDKDEVWSVLAQRSISRYRDLERQTGIEFYEDVGFLNISPEGEEVGIRMASMVQKFKLPASVGKWNKFRSKYKLGYFNLDDNHQAVLEHTSAGFINPRLLVEAELLAARNRGCDVMRDVVSKVTENEKVLIILTEKGQTIQAKKVLLATGTFTNFNQLFPVGVKPKLDLVKQSVVLAEVSDDDREIFGRMPSLGYSHIEESGCISRFYMLPPIQYPDGKYYIKIGGHGQNTVNSEAEMRKWFCNPAPDVQRSDLIKILKDILPGFEPKSLLTDTCVSTGTPSLRPYIDMITTRFGVAVGGNFKAAKSCDEIGRLAADMIVHGEFHDPELSAEHFKFQTVSKL